MDELLTIEEAATRLNIQPWTLRSWVSQRKIPYVKLGRLIRFDPTALQRYIKQQSVDPVDFAREPR
jgi:excisionase family DNA binding protein